MSFATKDLKDIFKIKIKPRHDSLTDQYHRIFMVKLLLISSLVMGISWFKDSVNCLVPGMDIAQKMKFSIKNFFTKCDQIRRFLRIWSHLLKKSFMKSFIFLCSGTFYTEVYLTVEHVRQSFFIFIRRSVADV